MARKITDLAILLPALCCLGILVPGCQKDEIQTYVAPKPVEVKEAPPEGDGPEARMLAALIPHENEFWVLKMQGPLQLIASHKSEFEQVLRSFRFVDQKDKPVTWTTPPGWKGGPPSEMRYATLVLDSKDAPLEMSISEAGGTLTGNVNRWRNQLGLNPVVATNISKVTSQVKLESGNAVAVDIVGLAKKSPAMAMARGHGHPTAPPLPPPEGAEAPPLEYTMPNGWTPFREKASAFPAVVSFQVLEGNQEARVTVHQLSAKSGSLADNIDRWRKQIGLPEATPEELKNSIREFTVDGIRSPYVDLVGPSNAGGEPKRMLAAAVPQGESIWYFKVLGPAELVGRQKAAFEAFMSTVRFPGGHHG
jgi:hypothetical protein